MEASCVKRTGGSLVGLLLALSAFSSPARGDLFSGPVSRYYLDDGDTIYVVQGLSVVASFSTAYGRGDYEGALAVSDTIRTRAGDLRFGTGGQAGVYTLSGTPTGTAYQTAPTPDLVYYDGTSSGSVNYFVDHGQVNPANGGVYRAGYYWENPQLLFYPQGICNNPPSQPGCWGLWGIAYDPSDGSLWVSAGGSTVIQEYSLSGTLLASFDTGPLAGRSAALGVDPADHTLWTVSLGTNELVQYSPDAATLGALLQSGAPAGLPAGWYSGDFSQVPECSSWFPGLTAAALAGLLKRRHHPVL